MRILVVGNGGREHALLWKLSRDDPSAELYATRPNGGMAGLARAVPIAPTDIEALAGWARAEIIDLAVIGPEVPLAQGIADRFAKFGTPVFGPSAAAARIESSKAYAKDLMREAGVPTAGYRTFRDLEAAEGHLVEVGAPVVVKASGLAAGKGAVVCETVEEATLAVRSMLADFRFGEAGREVVIEEFMEGEELSVFALTDGENVVTLLPSQDHKRIGDGDTGPNTGGMGAYGPVSIATDALLGEVRDLVLLPTLAALAADDAPFRGLLYAGLMLTDAGPKVVEFNCRFGDPETQVVLPMMASPLLPLLVQIASGGSIAGMTAAARDGAALTTVLASGGYPGSYEKGKPITIPEDVESEHVLVFHAGTAISDGGLVTSGGRVLAVTGVGATLQEASGKSVAAAERIGFEGATYRRDIGWREFARAEAGRP